LSDLEDKLDHIKTALAELRATTDDGPETRKQLDSLFRQVHSLKAAASADGLTDLSRAAHELENVLHSLRTGESTLDNQVLEQLSETSAALSETLVGDLLYSLKAHEKHALKQSISEGARIFVVDASFDVADFDQEFQKLKEKLSSEGEVIAVFPRVDSESAEKIKFRILCAGPAVSALQRAVRAGQAAAAKLGKEIEFTVNSAELSLDDAIADCLLHLVRNAVHHGIESRGAIIIAATNDQDQLTIKVSDNGRGIDPQTLASGVLFQPGYSTASEVSEISGRGVGLDVVKTTVEARGGSVQIQSELGKGSTFQITLPLKSA
jgi:two-component system chemotaxis sensor kinase CheA